jgi:hypothetical protein
MSDEGYERVEAAIRLEPTDRVPVVPTLLAEAAAGLTGTLQGDMVSDNTLLIDTLFKLFDEYGGWDAICPGFSLPIQMQVTGGFPMKMRVSGQDLAPDIPTQLDEQEILQVEDYDKITEIGFDAFYREDYLWRVTKATSDEATDCMAQLMSADALFTECCRKRNISRLPAGNGVHPFFALSLMRSMVPFTQDIYYNPEPVERAIQRMTDDLIAAKIEEMKSWETNIWLLTEERAGGYFFSPKMFERFWWPYTKKIVEAMWEHGVVTMFHLDTCWDKNLAYFKELPRGSTVLEVDGTTDLALAKEILNDHACLKGDVPAALLALGSPDEVASYCKEKIDIVGAGGGYILSTGCCVPPNVKPENFRAMIDTAKNYRGKGR